MQIIHLPLLLITAVGSSEHREETAVDARFRIHKI